MEETCILCGKKYPTGLHILGCLICFPCEKQMLSASLPPKRLRALRRLYQAAEWIDTPTA